MNPPVFNAYAPAGTVRPSSASPASVGFGDGDGPSEGAAGGFAAALAQADTDAGTAPAAEEASVVDAAPLGPEGRAAPEATSPEATSAVVDAATASTAASASAAAIAAASAAASLVTAASSAAPDASAPGSATASTAGWPPPGLSSLFPGAGLFAGGESGAAAAASASAAGLGAFRARVALGAGAETLPDDAIGPIRPEAALPKTAAQAPAMATLGGVALPTTGLPGDAMALAMARQPVSTRLPLAESAIGEIGALAPFGEALAAERLPDGATPFASVASTATPRLDLTHAFPAPVPLPSPRFADEVGARLQWIAEQQGGEATLRIAPDGLGPVEVRMRLDGDRVELGFSATQQDTRQALQDALPRLREMLAQQGLQLGHADVGQRHAPSSNDSHGGRPSGSGDDDGEIDAIAIAPAARETARLVGRGVLDLYA